MRGFVAVAGLALVLGAALFAARAQLDRMARAHPDVAVRAGSDTFFVPAAFVRGTGWRTDLMRLGGCWDARDAAVIAGMAALTGCDRVHRLGLALPLTLFGDAAAPFHRQELSASFWLHYEPPAEELAELREAWEARGQWAGRKAALRADWQLVRIETPASPWVYLVTRAPRSAAELANVYAGRCYRPERTGDAGMTCDAALRVGETAVLEFSLGADEMMSFAAVCQALTAQAERWKRSAMVSMKIPALGHDFLGARMFVERDLVGRR